MVLVNSERLARDFICSVLENNNLGILQENLGEMRKTKFCGIPKLFLAKQLGRQYGILLYEEKVTILNKKTFSLFIDSKREKKSCALESH